MISRFLNLSNDFSQGVTVHSYLVPVTDFADASHSKSAKSAATTVSYGIFSSENAYLWTVTWYPPAEAFLYKDNLTSKSYWCNICMDVTGAQKENFFALKSYTCNKMRVEKMVVFRMLM